MSTGALKTRLLICGLIAAVCFCLVAVAATAGAENASVLQSRIDAARAQADELGARIEANASAITEALGRAEAAARREAELSAVLDQAEVKLAELERHVELTKAELERVRDRLADARDLLAARLIAIYKVGVPDATELLLSSDGFDDLTNRAPYLSKIQQADTILAGRVRQLRDEVELQLAAGREARDRQAAFNERLELARDQIASSRAAAEARAAELGELRRRQTAAVSELQDNIGAWAKRVEEIERISAAAAQQQVAGWLGEYSIPTAIVVCESGGDYDAVNPSSGAGGAYQIMPGTWELYGGKGAPEDGSKQEQDSIAAQIWADSGAAPWVCG